jgi:transposase
VRRRLLIWRSGRVTDVHPNRISAWKAQSVEGAAGLFGSGPTAKEAELTVDLKAFHAKNGELREEVV